MLNYMNSFDFVEFITIQTACEFLGMTKDELKAKCEQYGVEVTKFNGKWGFSPETFRGFNNTLYYEKIRDGINDSNIWADIHACKADYLSNQKIQSKQNVKNPVVYSYMKTIKDLKIVYTYDEACQLLGITPEWLHLICVCHHIPQFTNSVRMPILTCYDFLTVNNILYRDQCWSRCSK